jgi:uncharacterized membrane protein
MLIESIAHLPVSPATFQRFLTMPDAGSLMHLLVRWVHFVAGITWIGILYFFNLVNVKFMKALDAPTKGKVIPELMPRALWYFRWGALLTVLAGLMYYAMYIVPTEAKPANLDSSAQLGLLGLWLLVVLVTYAILFFLYRVPALTKDGRILAVVIAILVIAMSAAILYVLGTKSNSCDSIGNCTYLGNKTLSIGVGGGIGILMMLNVWGIIWPAQKRIIAWTKDNAQNGTPIPPESAALARKAFLASRTNAWLSLPMLLLMAQSHDISFFTNK